MVLGVYKSPVCHQTSATIMIICLTVTTLSANPHLNVIVMCQAGKLFTQNTPTQKRDKKTEQKMMYSIRLEQTESESGITPEHVFAVAAVLNKQDAMAGGDQLFTLG